MKRETPPYVSKSGYAGAGALIFFSLLAALDFRRIEAVLVGWNIGSNLFLIAIVFASFFVMLGAELLQRRSYKRRWSTTIHPPSLSDPASARLLRSAFWRFFTYGVVFGLMWAVVSFHYYFSSSFFSMTRDYANLMISLYLILGFPYVWLTLKKKGGLRYEFGDYAILLMIFARRSWRNLRRKENHRLWSDRRIRKVLLSYLVSFFFLTLMARFFASEFHNFLKQMQVVTSRFYDGLSEFQQFKAWYDLFYHLLFVVDVGIAVIGYTVATRWLDNRSRSVDPTFSGWIVALMCYPPLNSGFADHFIGYGNLVTHSVVQSEGIRMVLMGLILFLFTLYVWGTVALGFKFSNLTNRGIIDHGPYKFVRHPAYATKNLAWWLENTFVFSNFFAAAALFVWNLVYVARGLTEERHLGKDPDYDAYVKKVKYRFIPGVI